MFFRVAGEDHARSLDEHFPGGQYHFKSLLPYLGENPIVGSPKFLAGSDMQDGQPATGFQFMEFDSVNVQRPASSFASSFGA